MIIPIVNEYPSHGFRQPFELVEPTYLTKVVKLPTFFGIDPQGWLTRVETYFKVQGTLEHHRIPLAHICMVWPSIGFPLYGN